MARFGVRSRADMIASAIPNGARAMGERPIGDSPIRPRRTMPAARGLAVLTAAALAVAGAPAHAQQSQGGPPIIRDAEIEQLLREYSAPILKAAGLAQQNVRIVIINDRSFNAFVADGHRIFINSGALMQAKTPNEVIGVLAHETGHLAGGHLARMREELANATTESLVAMLLGLGALVAGARSGAGSNGAQIGAAAISVPQNAIQNSLIAYIRTQEEQAD